MHLVSALMPAPLLIPLSIISWHAGQLTWLFADFLATMTFGISLLLTPNYLLSYQTDVRLDPVSPYLARLIGLLLLASSIHSHTAFSARNKQQCASLSASRATTAFMMLLCTTYATHHYTQWNFRFTQLSITGAACWFLPHFYYALCTTSTAPPEPHGIVVFLILDYFMTVAIGLACFAFPQCLLRYLTQVQPNGVSVTLARVLGSLFVGLGLESQAATTYTSLATKKSVHLSRLATCGPMFVLVLCASSLKRAFNDAHLLLGIAAVFAWAANSALGYVVVTLMQRANDHCLQSRSRAEHGFVKDIGTIAHSQHKCMDLARCATISRRDSWSNGNKAVTQNTA